MAEFTFYKLQKGIFSFQKSYVLHSKLLFYYIRT